jgi:DNA-binding MarR family transcriptional regulator
MDDKYNALLLERQLCFPLYACARETIKLYKPFLDELNLTYTQYITMMVLWERNAVSVKELGEALYLDSGTLTPLLKKMEAKGLLTRRRSPEDERSLIVTLTDKGRDMRDKALDVPAKMSRCVVLSREESLELYRLLYKLLKQNSEE